MIDLIYVFGTLVFFGLMVLYVAACERLGRSGEVDRGQGEAR